MPVARSYLLGAVLALAAAAASVAPAAAQAMERQVLAEQLYEQGRELVKAGRWAEACPKFEASLGYDAALGARLNLAACYEKIGRLASAWGMFRDAAALALRAGDTARQDYALQQAEALLPRLPKLTITGPAKPPPGLAIKRDGVALELATLGTALYVDPGPHEVTASAPGFAPFKAQITVVEGRSEAVVIHALAPVKPQAQEAEQAEQEQEQAEQEQERQVSGARAGWLEPGRTRKLAGIGVVGSGVVLSGVGLLFGARARATYQEVKALCGDALICGSDITYAQGSQLVDQAHRQAALSTVLVISGVVAVATGVAVYVTAPKRERAETAVVPFVADRDLGLVLMGRF